MVQVAGYTVLLKPELAVPDTRPEHSSPAPLQINAASIAANGHNFAEALQTSVSSVALRTPANENSAFLAELNKRIQANPRIQAANQIEIMPAIAEDAKPDVALSVDPSIEQPASVAPVLTSVERTQIELAETVKFIKELRADPELRMSKREAKQFLNFAAGQAALATVGENALHADIAPVAADVAVTIADGVAVKKPSVLKQHQIADVADPASAVQADPQLASTGQASAIQINPLALKALADNFDHVMRLADTQPEAAINATTKTAFQTNRDMMVDTQPAGMDAPQVEILPSPLQSELKVIAEDNQFNPALVRRAYELQQVKPDPNSQPQMGVLRIVKPQALPVALAAESNEKKVQDLIVEAKQEQDNIEKMKLSAHVDNYMRARALEVTFTSGHTSEIKIDRTMVNTSLNKTVELKPEMTLSDRRLETDNHKNKIALNYDENFNKQANNLMNLTSVKHVEVREKINHNITHVGKADGKPLILNSLYDNASDVGARAQRPVIDGLNATSAFNHGLTAA